MRSSHQSLEQWLIVKDGGLWTVRRSVNQRASARFVTQRAAIAYAKARLNQVCNIIAVFTTDGRISKIIH